MILMKLAIQGLFIDVYNTAFTQNLGVRGGESEKVKNNMVESDGSLKSLTSALKARVVVAIPCYNTQEHIADVIAHSKKYVDDVIVIDDGSTDKTADVARRAGAKVISHSRNRGKGAAMKTIAKNIEADIIVFIDGDGQHNPEDIPKLVAPIVQGKADFVIGSRYLSESQLSANPFLRKAANKIASFIISFIISIMQPIAKFITGKQRQKSSRVENQAQHVAVGTVNVTNYKILKGTFKWVSDCTCGFTAMKKENFGKLNLISDGFQIEAEMIYEQAKNGFIIAETPISCTWEGSQSKLSVIKDGLRTLLLLIKKLLNYSHV